MPGCGVESVDCSRVDGLGVGLVDFLFLSVGRAQLMKRIARAKQKS